MSDETACLEVAQDPTVLQENLGPPCVREFSGDNPGGGSKRRRSVHTLPGRIRFRFYGDLSSPRNYFFATGLGPGF